MDLKTILTLFLILFASILLPLGTPNASAQSCAARTCSEAYSACTGKNCARQHSGGRDCARFCGMELERCRKTGEFRGRVCHKTRLIRK